LREVERERAREEEKGFWEKKSLKSLKRWRFEELK